MSATRPVITVASSARTDPWVDLMGHLPCICHRVRHCAITKKAHCAITKKA
jgi:hypothetical protein